jgi:hypothetical protein
MSATYNLVGTVHFPARIINRSISAINNIFIGKTSNYAISPFKNSMSNRDSQVLTLNNIFTEMSSL